MTDRPDIVEVIVHNNPHVIEVVGGYQGPPGPDPWLDPIQDITATGSTTTIDYSLGKFIRLRLEASTSLILTGWPIPDRQARMTIEIQNTGSYTITWPVSVLWPAGGIVPTATPNGTDVIVLSTTSGGTVVYGFPAGLDFA